MKRAFPAAAALLTFLVFLPALHCGFLNLDDPLNFLDNPHVRGITLENLSWMFTTFRGSHYQPLSWLSFALDHALWGFSPAGWHFTSIVLHAFNAALLCVLGAELISLAVPAAGAAAWWGGLFAALLFALHPLRVESVVWASERGDELSCFFYLLGLLCYLRDKRGGALAAFLLALLSKSIAVTFPLALLILDVYPLRRFHGWGSLKEKWPFFGLAAADGLLALYGQKTSGAMAPVSNFGPLARAAQAAHGLEFYVQKTVWPSGLSAIYELPARFDPFAARYVVSGAFVVLATAALWRLRRRAPAALAAWAFYAITLLPLLGTFQSGPQETADRYSYLACASFAVLAGGALSETLRRAGKLLCLSGAAVVLAALSALTLRQQGFWKNPETVWRHALQVDPGSAWARTWLAGALSDEGKNAQSEALYREAIALRPLAEAHYGLGVTLERLHRPHEAIVEYTRAIALEPSHEQAHYNLATLLGTGDPEEARLQFQAALALDPEDASAAYNLGNVLAAQHDAAGALAAYQTAVRLRPGDPRFENNLGALLAALGRLGDAEAAYRAGLARAPQDEALLGNLGLVLASQGDLREAVEVYRKSLRYDPRNPVTHNNLGIALAESGQLEAAAGEFRAALALQPDYSDARYNMERLRTLH